MNALTDTQLVILSKASQREDRAVELPPNLRGRAADVSISKLMRLGLVEEVPARSGIPVWRRDEAGTTYALLITPAALEALGLASEDEAPQQRAPAAADPPPADSPDGGDGGAVASDCDAGAHARSSPGTAASDPGDTTGSVPHEGSKTAQLIRLLERENGATVAEITEALGWLPHTARAALTGLRKRGYRVLKERRDDGVTAYRIAPPDAASPQSCCEDQDASRRRRA